MAGNETSGLAEENVDTQPKYIAEATSEKINISNEVQSEAKTNSAADVEKLTGGAMDKTTDTSIEAQSEAQGTAATEVEKLTTFPIFPKLIPEMRNLVWKWASFITRDLGVQCVQYTVMKVVDTKYYPCWFSSLTPAPAILHVSKEARREGLKYYKLLFGTEQKIDVFTVITPPRIYVNTWSDRICFHGTSSCDETDKLLFKLIADYGIRKLAVDVKHLVGAGEERDVNVLLYNRIKDWFRLHMDEVVVYCSVRATFVHIGLDYEFVENTGDVREWPEALKETKRRAECDPMAVFEQCARDVKIQVCKDRRKARGDPEPKEEEIPTKELEEISGPEINFMVVGRVEGGQDAWELDAEGDWV